MIKPKRKINAKRKIKLRRLDFAIRKAVETLKNGACNGKCSGCLLAKTNYTCFVMCHQCDKQYKCKLTTQGEMDECNKLRTDALELIKKKLNIAVKKNMELRMEL